MTAATSPCVKICVIDETKALCRGCGRTLEEIAAWSRMDEAARLTIMAALPQRMAELGNARAEGGPS